MLRKPGIFFSLILFVGFIGKVWHFAKDGFNIQRTRFPLGQHILADPDSETRAALSQSYHYLGRGHQCYAFESSDRQYVLKLPRYDRYKLPFWLEACRFPFLKNFRQEVQKDKEKRLQFTLNSFRIAFEELKKETALLYLHFDQTRTFTFSVRIIDRIGRSYWLDLDRTAFILQRKKPLMMPAFQQAITEGNREQAKQILDALLDMIVIRAKKGIFNKDPSFLRNFGYDGEGIQIDIGSFYHREDLELSAIFAPSFLQTVGHVQDWLNRIDPEMATWFKKRTEVAIQ